MSFEKRIFHHVGGINYWLRRWSISDLDSLLRYADNLAISGNLTDQFPSPYTKERGRTFIETVSTIEPPRVFCISTDHEAIGAIGIHPQSDIWSRNMELGYWLAQPYWGNGIMTAAIKEVVQIGFSTFDVDRIFARPFGGNIGSQRALEKAGFVLEAKLERTIYKKGVYHDEMIFGVRR